MNIIEQNNNARKSIIEREENLQIIRRMIEIKMKQNTGFGIAASKDIDEREVFDIIKEETLKINKDIMIDYVEDDYRDIHYEKNLEKYGYYTLFIGFFCDNTSKVYQFNYKSVIPMFVEGDIFMYKSPDMLTLEIDDINEIKRGAKND